MNHDRVLHSIGIAFPDPFIDFLRRVYPARIGHQHLQVLELGSGEPNCLTPDDKLFCSGVQNNVLSLIFRFSLAPVRAWSRSFSLVSPSFSFATVIGSCAVLGAAAAGTAIEIAAAISAGS